MRYRWMLPAALLLAGCSKAEGEAVAEAIAQVIIVGMIIMFVGLCISVLFLLFELAVVVWNFARPSRVSMVLGYVLAGLHGVGMLGSIALVALPAADAAPADPTAGILDLVVGLFGTVAMGVLLGGSSYYAQRKLAPPPVPTE